MHPSRPLLPASFVAALVAALLTAGTMAPAARADLPDGPTVTDEPQVASWLAIAERHWRQRPDCPQGVRVIRAAWSDLPDVWASALTPGCVMALHPAYFPMPRDWYAPFWARGMCNIVAHEWGHLLGLPHDDDPQSLMLFQPPRIVSECAAPEERATRPPTRRAKPAVSRPRKPARCTHRKRRREFDPPPCRRRKAASRPLGRRFER